MKLGNVISYDQVVSKVEVDGFEGYSRSATYTLDDPSLYLTVELILIPLEDDGKIRVSDRYIFHSVMSDVNGSIVETHVFDNEMESEYPTSEAKRVVRDYDFFENEGVEG